MTKPKNPNNQWAAPGLGLRVSETCVPTAALNAFLDQPLTEMARKYGDEGTVYNGHLELAERIEVILRTESRVTNRPHPEIDTICRKITHIRQERRPVTALRWADLVLLAVGISISATDLPILPAGLPAAREMVDSWLACDRKRTLSQKEYDARVLDHLTSLEPYLPDYARFHAPEDIYANA